MRISKSISASTVMNLLSALTRLIDNTLNNLAKAGLEVKDKKETKNKDGGVDYIYIYHPSNNEDINIEVTLRYSKEQMEQLKKSGEEKATCTLNISDGKNEETVENITHKEIERKITKFLEKYYDTDSFFKEVSEVNSSQRFQIGLKKITASKESRIELTRVNCSLTTADMVMQSIQTALEDEDFVGTLGEDETYFEVVDDGSDSLDVNTVESIESMDTRSMLEDILVSLYRLHSSLKSIQWNASGTDFDSLRTYANSTLWRVNDEIDYIAEMCVEFTGLVSSPMNLLSRVDNALELAAGYDSVTAFSSIQSAVSEYISKLECYYCEMSHDVQNMFDQWIRYWSHEANYMLGRR